jgi:hypothetical protein
LRLSDRREQWIGPLVEGPGPEDYEGQQGQEILGADVDPQPHWIG